jgi:aspartyl-tRNA(Asn)/glutamyl-tRNA(Gln) amidotransferase subunit C
VAEIGEAGESADVASPAVTDRITPDAVAHVARLARLELTPDELTQYTGQLGSMLEHFRDIDTLDLADVEPMTQPLPLQNVLRDDVIGPTLDREEVLAAAPEAEAGRFRVPPILGETP